VSTLRDRQIVCVGFADWRTELWTNQQHLMSRLAAQGNEVLFVESLGLRKPAFAGRDIRRIARRLGRGLRPWLRRPPLHDGVYVLSPLVLPLHSNRFVRALNRRLLRGVVRLNARRIGFDRPLLWAYVPQAEVLLDALDPSYVVYHCVDDIAAQERVDTASFEDAERRYAARADLVLASAPRLAERMRALSDNVLYAPNVADTELFATALEEGPVDPAVEALARPRLVFTGAVSAAKLDFDLLLAVARANPQWQIALVGPVGAGDPLTDVSELQAEANIHLLGARDYEQLPAVLRGADAGLIPYRRSQLTDSIFPMKVYEYLAAGLPVIATDLPALEGVGAVARAQTPAAFSKAVAGELKRDSPKRRAQRSANAAQHSWSARLQEISDAIGGSGG
jgi:glycosyltransferase involved in cell wall biosynthesis